MTTEVLIKKIITDRDPIPRIQEILDFLYGGKLDSRLLDQGKAY